MDEKRYPIKPHLGEDILDYWRFEHRVTLQENGRQFLVIVDNGIIINNEYTENPKLYIEELTVTGKLIVVEEDELHEELIDYAQEHGFCNILPPLPKDTNNRVL